MSTTDTPPEERRLALPLTDTELPRLRTGPVAEDTKRGQRIALTVVVVLCFLTVAWIASPLWVGLALGTVMAFTAQPMFRAVSVRLGDRRVLAAVLTTVLTGVMAAGSGAAALYVISRELIDLAQLFQRKMASGSLVDIVGAPTVHLAERLGFKQADLMGYVRHQLGTATEYATAAAGIILQTTSGMILGLIIGLMTMYYVLLEWPRIAVRLERLLPLDPRHTRALILEFRDVGRSSFVGTLATAVVQGVLGGVGYELAGLTNAVSLGMLTALASFFPVIGTAIVWAAVAAYLLAIGEPLTAIFMVGWGLLVVQALSDYVIRPRLVGGKGHGHPLLMLIALLGGIEVFGLAGLIVAPMLMSLFLAALRIYEREIAAEMAARATGTPLKRRATDRTSTPPPATTVPSEGGPDTAKDGAGPPSAGKD